MSSINLSCLLNDALIIFFHLRCQDWDSVYVINYFNWETTIFFEGVCLFLYHCGKGKTWWPDFAFFLTLGVFLGALITHASVGHKSLKLSRDACVHCPHLKDVKFKNLLFKIIRGGKWKMPKKGVLDGFGPWIYFIVLRILNSSILRTGLFRFQKYNLKTVVYLKIEEVKQKSNKWFVQLPVFKWLHLIKTLCCSLNVSLLNLRLLKL